MKDEVNSVLMAFKGAGKPTVLPRDALTRCIYCGKHGGIHDEQCAASEARVTSLDVDTAKSTYPYGVGKCIRPDTFRGDHAPIKLAQPLGERLAWTVLGAMIGAVYGIVWFMGATGG